MLSVIRSPRLEPLVRRLVDNLQHDRKTGDPLDPMQAQQVIVHSQGMGRWVRMALADAWGICANVELAFPQTLLQDAFRQGLGKDTAELTAWEPGRMTLAITDVLPALLDRPAFELLSRYLGERPQGDPARLLALAQQIAALFDRYLVYRDADVLAWEDSGALTGHWQAELWRELADHLPGTHLARLAKGFCAASTATGFDLGPFTPTHIFAVAPLPALYLRVCEAISRHRPVTLYMVTPFLAADYPVATSGHAEPPDRLPPLLASCGRAAYDQQRLLVGVPARHEILPDPSAAPDSLLARLQRDLIDSPDASQTPPTPHTVTPTDDSIRIHACHSRLRQVEVVRDALLALFDAQPDLQPRDVAVLTPDVTGFAPLITAVFGDGAATGDPTADASGFPRLPFAIADGGQENPAAAAISAILALADSRVTLAGVFALLALPIVRDCCGLSIADTERARDWAEGARIAWGQDADDRERHGQPAYDENTWRFGLRRLLLGYAMPGDGTETFDGVLPYPEIGEDGTIALGRFVGFCERLFFACDSCHAPATVPVWVARLDTMMADLIADTPETAEPIQAVRGRWRELAADAETVGSATRFDLAAMRQLLDSRLDFAGQAAGLLTGRITVSSLVSLRQVPFRVVCLLGLDEATFPNRQRPVSFDRMAEFPLPGDRCQEDEDRQMFLDALLAARERLIITYTGRDSATNTSLPQSVPVSELLEAIQSRFTLSGEGPAPEREARLRRQILKDHPLQAFSPTHFDSGQDTGPSSYDRRLLVGAQRLQVTRNPASPRVAAPPFFPVGLSAAAPTDGPTQSIALADLIAFWQDPFKELLRARLGVMFRAPEDADPEREPILLDGLDTYAIGEILLRLATVGVAPGEASDLIRAGGWLPMGKPGRRHGETLQTLAAGILTLARAHDTGMPARSQAIDVNLGGVRLVGNIDGLWDRGRVEVRFASLRPKYCLATWIRHLALQAAAPDQPLANSSDRPLGAWLIGHQKQVPLEIAFAPTDTTTARQTLTTLIQLRDVGMTVPLLFFPATSFAYEAARIKASAKDAPDPHEAARKAAGSKWTSQPPGGWGEGESFHVKRLLGNRGDAPYDLDADLPGAAALGPTFAELAETVWGAYLAQGHGEPV
ncbi:MAG: exodeoxyribonuclease V subunit gamma [Candidatus Sericytochromatia bacterium]|nr:exodeoxyribonuclease V subunit gamma [Candidatus Sericytochromatia bacterium]